MSDHHVKRAREIYREALEEAGGAGAGFIENGGDNLWTAPAITAIATLLSGGRRPRCETCRYFDTSISDDNSRSPCRVMPPFIPIGQYVGAWPMVEDVDWCGSYVADLGKVDEAENGDV